MTQILVHVEGETEETFVNEVLREHLHAFGYGAVGARLIGNARLRQRRGGIRAWSSVRDDIARHLREDPSAISTTMIDYYGLPQTGPRAWPGRAAASQLRFDLRATTVESALEADVKEKM